MRREAQRLQHIGQYADAVQLQVALINQQGGYAAERAEDMHLLGLYLFQLGDITAARTVLQQVFEFLPEDVDVGKNLAICEMKLGKVEDALTILRSVSTRSPENFEVRDVFAHAAGMKGDRELAREQGTLSLTLKHNAVTKKHRPILNQTKKLTEPQNLGSEYRDKNIISFSLWGTNAKYLDGAVQNARLAKDIYPAWRCRFYIDDSVPMAVVGKLRSHDAQIIEKPQQKKMFDGLFWRFLVADDPGVERFIVRDCDAMINIRERAAVDLWCRSNRRFHAMRDFYTHSELILAGLWGGVNQALPNVGELIETFKTRQQLRTRIVDQVFLREEIWPRVHQDILVHDSQFSFANSESFPVYATLPDGHHVGQDRTIFS